MDPKVDKQLAKTTRWRQESEAARALLLDCGLDEAFKWGKPCYSHKDSNIVIMQNMKSFLAVMFFKGALLEDPDGVLEEQGENTRSARRVCLTSVQQIKELEGTIRALVANAIDVDIAGLTLPSPPPLQLAEELQSRLDSDPALKEAFESLTAGRQREYNLQITGAKQSSTRARRVEQHVPKILAGKGFRDR